MQKLFSVFGFIGLLIASSSIHAQSELTAATPINTLVDNKTLSANHSEPSSESSKSLNRDHRAFVDGLIADELRPPVIVNPPTATVVQDSTLLGKSEQPAPTFIPSMHFVGVSQMGNKPRLAELYYRGTTSHFATNARVPTGQIVKSISHTSVTLSEKVAVQKEESDDPSDDKDKDAKEVLTILPLTSIKEAQQERQRFKEGATFYKSLGLGQY